MQIGFFLKYTLNPHYKCYNLQCATHILHSTLARDQSSGHHTELGISHEEFSYAGVEYLVNSIDVDNTCQSRVN